MNLNDKVFQNNLVVGEITHVSKESIFVTFHGNDDPERFHKDTFRGFLKTKPMLPQYDKITDFYISVNGRMDHVRRIGAI